MRNAPSALQREVVLPGESILLRPCSDPVLVTIEKSSSDSVTVVVQRAPLLHLPPHQPNGDHP